MSSEILIEPGRVEDLSALAEIYNHYVLNSHATFDVEPVTLEERAEWFASFGETGPYRLFVARQGETVLGFASSSAFHPKRVYHSTIEIGVYTRPDRRSEGIGSRLYERMLPELEGELRVERLVAGITLPNDASLALHARFGFEAVGTFRRVGQRGGRFYDLQWLDRPARSG